MADPVICAVLLGASVVLALAGWGFWAHAAFRRRSVSEGERTAEEHVTIALPVRAELFVPPPDEGAAGDYPRWVLERMMDERFEPVEATATSDDSGWL